MLESIEPHHSCPAGRRAQDGPWFGLEVDPCRVGSPTALAERARRRGVQFAVEALAPESEIRGWFLAPPGTEARGLRAVHGKRFFVARRKHLRPEVLVEHPSRPEALYSGFVIALSLDLGWNEIELQFKDGERKWHTFCRCHVRLPWFWPLLRRISVRAATAGYESWTRQHGDPDLNELEAMRGFLRRFPRLPLLSILMPVYNTPKHWLRRAIESVRAQVYPAWELCIADDGSSDRAVRRLLNREARRDPRIKVCFRGENGHICRASNSALEMCRGEFTVLLDHDDEFPPHALFHVAWELVNHPGVSIIFSDEDKMDGRGVRSGPYFKPGWSYDLLLGQNCVSHLGAFRTSLLREVGGFRPGFEGSQDWDVTLRAVARAGAASVRHIPRVLYHWRALAGSTASSMKAKPYAAIAGRRAVEDHLRSVGSGARLQDVGESSWRILWPLPNPAPLVSLIVPVRERSTRFARLLASHFALSDYPRSEVLVSVNIHQERAVREELDALGCARDEVRVVRAAGITSWPELGNVGTREARGEILVFLSEKAEVVDPEWLRELARQAWRSEIGAVGGCLLYPDGTIEHAGVVLRMAGLTGNVFRGSPAGVPSIGGPPDMVREVTAIGRGCLAVRREVFERAGGFDAANLPMNFHDVDFCLGLRRLGLRNLFTPFSRLIHHEFPGRRAAARDGGGRSALAAEGLRLLERWPREFLGDAFFNPNLSLGIEIPVASVPRAAWPWLEGQSRGRMRG